MQPDDDTIFIESVLSADLYNVGFFTGQLIGTPTQLTTELMPPDINGPSNIVTLSGSFTNLSMGIESFNYVFTPYSQSWGLDSDDLGLAGYYFAPSIFDGNAVLHFEDYNGRWTITAVDVPLPASFVLGLIALGGLFVTQTVGSQRKQSPIEGVWSQALHLPLVSTSLLLDDEKCKA